MIFINNLSRQSCVFFNRENYRNFFSLIKNEIDIKNDKNRIFDLDFEEILRVDVHLKIIQFCINTFILFFYFYNCKNKLLLHFHIHFFKKI
jgi:hypothetical protein